MQIATKQVDDFKTERKDVTPPLPTVLRLVPLLLYLSILVAVVLGAVFFLQLQIAIKKREGHRVQTENIAVETQQAQAERSALEAEIKKATDVEAWVTGSRPLQPLLVEIARSMGPRSSLIDLRIDRDPEAPARLNLSMKIGTDTTKQLDTTLDRIASHDYRTFSPQQNLGRGELDYRATLVSRQQRQSENLDTATPTTPNP